MTFNIQKLYKIVEAAKNKAPEMASQIDKAADMLLCNPFIHPQEDGGLLIMSSNDNSDNIYVAGHNHCQCKAADFNRVCWHRVANRLVRQYNWRQGH